MHILHNILYKIVLSEQNIAFYMCTKISKMLKNVNYCIAL